MSDRRLRRYAIGDRIGPRHTVLGVIDDKRGRHPVYMAWDHRDWCPMACKVFRSAAGAEREGAILSSLAHPNVVRLLHRDGAALFLEFLEGLSLSRFVDDRRGGSASRTRCGSACTSARPSRTCTARA